MSTCDLYENSWLIKALSMEHQSKIIRKVVINFTRSSEFSDIIVDSGQIIEKINQSSKYIYSWDDGCPLNLLWSSFHDAYNSYTVYLKLTWCYMLSITGKNM